MTKKLSALRLFLGTSHHDDVMLESADGLLSNRLLLCTIHIANNGIRLNVDVDTKIRYQLHV